MFLLRTIIIFITLSFTQCFANIKDIPIYNYNGKKWYLAFSYPSKEQAVTQIIPVGETTANWKEMVTLETLPPLKKPPIAYVDFFIRNIEERIKGKIEHHILRKTKYDIVVEWWVPSNQSYAQHEWYKLIKYSDQTAIFHYTTKNVSPNAITKSRVYWEPYIMNWDAKTIMPTHKLSDYT